MKKAYTQGRKVRRGYFEAIQPNTGVAIVMVTKVPVKR